jgi:hypothetical protein
MGFYDFDNAGFVFTANSRFPALDRFLRTLATLPNSLFRNLGNGRFDVAADQILRVHEP